MGYNILLAGELECWEGRFLILCGGELERERVCGGGFRLVF